MKQKFTLFIPVLFLCLILSSTAGLSAAPVQTSAQKTEQQNTEHKTDQNTRQNNGQNTKQKTEKKETEKKTTAKEEQKKPEVYDIRAPHMYAHGYVVMDANTGEVLFGENTDKKLYPASTAKLMSAIVAVESGTPLDTVIESKGKIVNHTTPGTYNLGMHGGEKYSLSALLNMSLIASAADATDTMAVGLYGSRADFAEKMNEKAEELGLTHTSFDNPVGSDIGGGFKKTYSTAREMSEIARYAMSLDVIRNITVKSHYKIHGSGSQNGRRISNTNWFYTQMPYNDHLFTIIGSKTGTTYAAGHVFIATAVDHEGHELICAFFGKESKDRTFRDINFLLTYAMKEYKKGNLHLTKGAYNVRYDKDAAAYSRCMEAGLLHHDDARRIDTGASVTEKEAAAMMKAILAPDLKGTRIHCDFDCVKGTSSACTKDFICKALAAAAPGIEKLNPVRGVIRKLPETLTVKDVVRLLGTASRNFILYQASFPTYEMRTCTDQNPVPFMSPMNLTEEFCLSVKEDQ